MIDSFDGIHGRLIWELRRFNPRDLTPREFRWEDPYEELRMGGKWRYVDKYVERLRMGEEPPPITVIQSEGGDLRVIDGHRRLAAADIVGTPIMAWVSWTVPSPEGTMTGLTYEIAQGMKVVRDNPMAIKRRCLR